MEFLITVLIIVLQKCQILNFRLENFVIQTFDKSLNQNFRIMFYLLCTFLACAETAPTQNNES